MRNMYACVSECVCVTVTRVGRQSERVSVRECISKLFQSLLYL